MSNLVGPAYFGDVLARFRFDIIRTPYKGNEIEVLVLTAMSKQGVKHAWGMPKPMAMKLRNELNKMHARFGHGIDYLAPEVIEFAVSDAPELLPGVLVKEADILKILHLDVGSQVYILDATTMGDDTKRVSLSAILAPVFTSQLTDALDAMR